ncbi:carnitine/acyl carnitine carrier [Mycena albidolilacea]|uniref:Carnitine/acyl carnitine carrier n=1 Tax=Mycena albidolilacea TaxID=1033008 RepID=A0AAD7ADI8_9AGAR|nr:carnitine/acyl carnitine carrier [Mycena albidolilacea]
MADGGELNPTVDFLAGTLAGTAGLIAGFPFDTVKVRLQTPELAGHYRGSITRAIATIVNEERVFGLYKGITSPLLTFALMNGLVFASYKFFLRLQCPLIADASLTQITLAGMGSGVISAIITTPTELIKIRQQQWTGTSTARGVAAGIFKAGGFTGLYRGSLSTALRDCGYGAYFASYEATVRTLTAPGGKREGWPVLVAGAVAGIVGWLVTFPLDVVKTRVQGSGPGALLSPGTAPIIGGAETPVVNPYCTTWSTIVHSYRAEGLLVFYRGLAPTLIRAVPVNMVTFGVFEIIVNAFG